MLLRIYSFVTDIGAQLHDLYNKMQKFLFFWRFTENVERKKSVDFSLIATKFDRYCCMK